jgi:hypothetical protein
MAQALGYTAEAMEGHDGEDFLYDPGGEFRGGVLRCLDEGSACRATTRCRHGLSGEALWVTFEIVPMAPSSPSLILVSLLVVDVTGTDKVEALPGPVDPGQRLRALDLDVGMMLYRQVSDLRENTERREALRNAIQSALRELLAEERTASTIDERVRELEDRVDRLIALMTTSGREQGSAGPASGADASRA